MRGLGGSFARHSIGGDSGTVADGTHDVFRGSNETCYRFTTVVVADAHVPLVLSDIEECTRGIPALLHKLVECLGVVLFRLGGNADEAEQTDQKKFREFHRNSPLKSGNLTFLLTIIQQ